MQPIEIYDEYIGNIPVIHVVPAGEKDKALPTIFHFHGYTSSKELHSFFGYAFARAGFRVILPEAIQHGQRFDGNIERRRYQFWEILERNIDEFALYVSHYQKKGLLIEGKIGISGTSMGGFTVLGLLAKYTNINAAASYMGSGFFATLSHNLFPPVPINNEADFAQVDRIMTNLNKLDSRMNLAALGAVPLFLWHGKQDEIVPVYESEALYAELQHHDYAAKTTLIIDENATHKVTTEALYQGVAFFHNML
ncbi:esterase [Martelella alba]|uniref:esterase n=1 Tax=Martelella alba TaxID=2590451 RepID=UPI001485A3CC|nr:esterase [Martelella alba]